MCLTDHGGEHQVAFGLGKQGYLGRQTKANAMYSRFNQIFNFTFQTFRVDARDLIEGQR